MNPYLTRSVADAHITDLHREAAHRRLARQVAPSTSSRTGIGTSVSADLAATRAALTGWLNARTHRANDPACCPAAEPDACCG